MPDRPQSTPPPIPPVTHAEEEAQSYLRRTLELLWFLEFFLELANSRLQYPPNAEAMGTGEVPESLSFALLGAIECGIADHVNPLHNLLRDAVSETPERLIRDWQKRQRGRK